MGVIRELPATEVRECLGKVLAAELGLESEAVEATIDHLLRTEQAGKDCHGLRRVHYLVNSGKFGPYHGKRNPSITRRSMGCLHVDGQGQLGYPLMQRVVEAGCEAAQQQGQALVTGVDVYPSGCLGDWSRLAAARGVTTLLLGGSPPRVAAPGGCTPLVGTNPFCIGIPTRPVAFVSDAATSAITHGDLLRSRTAGTALPPGCAVNSSRQHTMDATEVDPTRGLGALLAVGDSHKSFALSVAIELLTSLGGGLPGSTKLSEHGIFAVFIGSDALSDALPRLDEWLAGLDESGVHVPGWNSGRQLAAQAERGVVRMPDSTFELLKHWLEAPTP